MSESKYKKSPEVNGCDGCVFISGLSTGCKRPSSFIGGCLSGKYIWVIDDSAIETEKPKSPWVEIEDAELIDGEKYHFHTINGEIDLGRWCEISLYNFNENTFDDVWVIESIYTNGGFTKDRITHVIHLPKPQPPEFYED